MSGSDTFRLNLIAVLAALGMSLAAPMSRADTVASLLGNFTINQFSGLTVSDRSIEVHYAIVYAQLPALRELHLADANGDGITSQSERDAYVGGMAPGFADSLMVLVDGVRVPLRATHWSSSLPTEQGGFSLRVDADFIGAFPAVGNAHTHTIQFSNQNYSGRIGWHEIVVTGTHGIAVFNTNAFSTSATNALTEALQSLPASGPLDERVVHLVESKTLPPGALAIGPRPDSEMAPLKAQNGVAPPRRVGFSESAWIRDKTKSLIDAISAPKLQPQIALWALLAALALGAVHALSPGHGKTIVGAYLIGSRGTPRHAAFLGLTVTVTHTIGVFAVGFATLYASKFIMPEKLFPILSLISAVLVLGMGLVLLVQRARAASRALRPAATAERPMFFAVAAPVRGFVLPHQHVGTHHHGDGHIHAHAHETMHSHGGGLMHSHLPPGARGESVTWKSLLALGISGGLVPCPSAMVLLLAAIALNKTAYGMLLVLVFSVGLAITLTLVGLAFLHARNRFSRPNSNARWPQLLPVLSAATITLLGLALCYGALKELA